METKTNTLSKFYYGWVMLFMGFMFMFICYVIKANCSSLFITPITEELGVTRTAYTMNNTIMTITMLIASAFMGRIMGKFKMRYILTGCVAIICVTFLLMSRATSLMHFYLLSAVQGFAWAGATNLPVNVLVSNWFGPKIKGTAMSIGMLGSGVGALVWVNTIQSVMSNSGWRSAYLAMAGVMAIMLPLCLLLVVNRPAEKGFDRRVGDPSAAEIESSGGVSIQKRGIDGITALKLPRWWLQVAAHLLTLVCASGFTTQCVAYYVDLGMEQADAALIYSGALGTLTVGKFVLGAISDKLNIRRTAVIAPVIFSVTFLFLFLDGGNMGFSQGVIWTYMIGGSIASVVPPLITAKNFGDKDYSTLASWMNMAGNVGQIIGPMMAAAIFDITGSYRSA
jgi:MFS family permease